MEDIAGIMHRLPIRYPYLMIDRIVTQEKDQVVAVKNVTINEPCFQGHFPEPLPPVMPGTLILEAMAQCAAFLLPQGTEIGYLVGISDAKFRHQVAPGDQLVISASKIRERQGLLQAQARATVNETVAATAKISITGKQATNVEQDN